MATICIYFWSLFHINVHFVCVLIQTPDKVQETGTPVWVCRLKLTERWISASACLLQTFTSQRFFSSCKSKHHTAKLSSTNRKLFTLRWSSLVISSYLTLRTNCYLNVKKLPKSCHLKKKDKNGQWKKWQFLAIKKKKGKFSTFK